ncbi:hypothetical protein [Aquabacterium sp.]|uniref:hypothetical protein n=1 Tax=Aquabacterium sp. TaxID=1872578 RepID=UPI003D6CE888
MTHTIPETAESLAAENDTIDGLARAAHHAIDRAVAAVEALGETHEAWVEAAGNEIRARPLTSLALAVAAGLLIDRLLR